MIKNLILPQSIQPNINKQISLLPDEGLSADPRKWTVDDVAQFITRLTNNLIAEVFYKADMNGKALLLTTKEYLHDTMKIKLGPSLIISSEVPKLCERVKSFFS